MPLTCPLLSHIVISYLASSNDYLALSCKLQSFIHKFQIMQAYLKNLCLKFCKFEKFVVTLHAN